MIWKILLTRCALLTVLCLAGATMVSAQAAANPCPPASRDAARVVLKPLVLERLGWFRRMYGLTSVNAKQLRLLQRRSDAPLCEKFNAALRMSFGDSRWAYTYYTLDGYYFLALVDRGDPRAGRVYHSGLFLLDSDLKLLATLVPR